VGGVGLQPLIQITLSENSVPEQLKELSCLPAKNYVCTPGNWANAACVQESHTEEIFFS
jgi:hypothetical protein